VVATVEEEAEAGKEMGGVQEEVTSVVVASDPLQMA